MQTIDSLWNMAAEEVKEVKLHSNSVNPTYETEIVVLVQENDPDALLLCLQAISSNTDLQANRLTITANSSDQKWINQIVSDLGLTPQVVLRFYELHSCSFSLADVYSHLSNPIHEDLVLLSSQAVVSQNWLSLLREAANSVEGIGIILPREIKRGNDPKAQYAIPYANGNYDIDAAISLRENILLHPTFFEEYGLIELSHFKLSCAYFSKALVLQTDLKSLAGMQDVDWVDHISRLTRYYHKMHIVYTPKVKVFHSSYFL